MGSDRNSGRERKGTRRRRCFGVAGSGHNITGFLERLSRGQEIADGGILSDAVYPGIELGLGMARLDDQRWLWAHGDE
ncbi:hypothetical protein M0R45_010151 [Rubus argutus]|uniref:Uncharacterized protein n=1 Tax=Rubus argutus TaxID=59490 RepID=A0AAW1Y812_RUBAR